MNIIRATKDNIIKSINFGGSKTETVKHVLQMQKVSLFPEYINSSSICNYSFFYLHFSLRLPFLCTEFAPNNVCT